jgi:hypothetical protein
MVNNTLNYCGHQVFFKLEKTMLRKLDLLPPLGDGDTSFAGLLE